MGELGESPERTSGWMKLATAGYYCGASMAVQFANKVIFQPSAFVGLRSQKVNFYR